MDKFSSKLTGKNGIVHTSVLDNVKLKAYLNCGKNFQKPQHWGVSSTTVPHKLQTLDKTFNPSDPYISLLKNGDNKLCLTGYLN